jgi:glycosyltransferase involved in cell wall biosynthesis
MEQLLSIITINFNNKEGLDKTLNSVFEQTYKSFEFIIIDGNSSDGSIDVLNFFDYKIDFWISESDTGIYNAMNKGVKASKGEYLLFLNSGDVLNGVTALSDFINNPLFYGDIIYGDYKFDKGEKIYPDVLTPLHFFKSSLPHQSSLIRRELFDIHGLYDEKFKIVSDKAFFIKCFLSNKVKFKHIKYFLSEVDLNGVSNNLENKKQVQKETKIMLKEYFGVSYIDYTNYVNLVQSYKELKKKTLKGILIRIKNKLIKYSKN